MFFFYDALLEFQYIYIHLGFGFCYTKRRHILLAMRIFL